MHLILETTARKGPNSLLPYIFWPLTLIFAAAALACVFWGVYNNERKMGYSKQVALGFGCLTLVAFFFSVAVYGQNFR